jgi:hypothetical protein
MDHTSPTNEIFLSAIGLHQIVVGLLFRFVSDCSTYIAYTSSDYCYHLGTVKGRRADGNNNTPLIKLGYGARYRIRWTTINTEYMVVYRMSFKANGQVLDGCPIHWSQGPNCAKILFNSALLGVGPIANQPDKNDT